MHSAPTNLQRVLLLVLLAVSGCQTLGASPPAQRTEPDTAAAMAEEAFAAPTPSASDAQPLDAELELGLDLDLDLDLAIHDPYEATNRRIFAANQFIDRWLLNPVARAYGRITPDAVEKSVRCFFANLDEPPIIVNDLLQLEGRRAARAAGRVLINTTLGVAGLWDPARRFGLKRHESDFGQTLGKAHVPAGPYIVLPVVGPSNPRDLIGGVIDIALHAEDWFAPLPVSLSAGGLDAITTKEHFRSELDQLELTAIDYYASIRAGYAMQRREKVKDRSAEKRR